MKAVILTRRPDAPVALLPGLLLVTDSAIVAPHRPLFLPDFADAWAMRLYPALRIDRLGKGIDPKFASRYIGAFTLALRLEPLGVVEEDSAFCGVFDNALALGDWIEAPQGSVGALAITCGDLTYSISPAQLAADRAVAAVSRYATLKTGDIVMPLTLPERMVATVGADVTATLNGQPCLNVRIR